MALTKKKTQKSIKKLWFIGQEFEDKLTKEFIKIVPYNLQSSICLSLFSKESFNSSGNLFHKLAALNNKVCQK